MTTAAESREPGSSSSASLPTNDNVITSPGPNDVLLGRGSGFSRKIGNIRYRLLVAERKETYVASSSQKVKNQIAREIFDEIHARGGRFLKQVEGKEGNKTAGWYAVEKSTALEKCKQSLREHQVPPSGKRRGVLKVEDLMSQTYAENESVAPLTAVLSSFAGMGTPAMAAGPTDSITTLFSSGGGDPGGGTLSRNLLSVLPPSMCPPATQPQTNFPLEMSAPSPVMASPFWTHQNPVSGMGLVCGYPLQLQRSAYSAATFQNLGGSSFSLGVQTPGLLATVPMRTQHTAKHRVNRSLGDELHESVRAEEITSKQVPEQANEEEEASEFLLDTLQEEPEQPMFTEKDREKERATLTDKEWEAALCDIYGRYCSISQSKKVKSTMDDKSVEFFVKQMRLEIVRIPNDRKMALLEAQGKCPAEEFSDARLERFLRCEGMDAKLGAQRFVNYWESRREVFGPEKFTMRMTLSEALRDDLVALEAGLVCLLPRSDLSGRPLLFLEACRLTKEGYTAESMLRAAWYVMEVAANQTTDGSIVRFIWLKDATIWNFDRKFCFQFTQLSKKCWPLVIKADHVLCMSTFLTYVTRPIILALKSRNMRTRTLNHDIPESEVPGALSEYGIEKDMLPTAMGGTLHFNQAEWIANRRATELEEIG